MSKVSEAKEAQGIESEVGMSGLLTAIVEGRGKVGGLCVKDPLEATGNADAVKQVVTLARRLGVKTHPLTDRSGLYLLRGDGEGVDLLEVLNEIVSELNALKIYTGFEAKRRLVRKMAKEMGIPQASERGANEQGK